MSTSRPGFNLLTRAGWSNLRVCKADMKMVWKDTVGPLTCLAMFGHKPFLSGTDIGCSRCGQYLAFPWYNPGDPKADRGLYRMYLIQNFKVRARYFIFGADEGYAVLSSPYELGHLTFFALDNPMQVIQNCRNVSQIYREMRDELETQLEKKDD